LRIFRGIAFRICGAAWLKALISDERLQNDSEHELQLLDWRWRNPRGKRSVISRTTFLSLAQLTGGVVELFLQFYWFLTSRLCTVTADDPVQSTSSSFCQGVITSLCLDTVSARIGHWAFAVAGPTAWNSLSDDLRDPTLSTDSFRCLLKTRLFSQYMQRVRGITLYALYKFTTYWLN